MLSNPACPPLAGLKALEEKIGKLGTKGKERNNGGRKDDK